ncbi:hypothetical protein LJC15_05685, partial [Desulfovibrio sp. OttesenSCG-928-G11]|nr:hypothetical protein [Desulfovibrio sp. OttesenSCG-928-G11]
VGPRLALASAGFGNRWGFPSLAARRALEERGVPLLDTGNAGCIRIVWDAPERMAPPLAARAGALPDSLRKP